MPSEWYFRQVYLFLYSCIVCVPPFHKMSSLHSTEILLLVLPLCMRFLLENMKWRDCLENVDIERIILKWILCNNLDISWGFTYSIIHEDVEYHKICARWMPKELTEEHKWACMEMSRQFSQQCHEGEAIMHRLSQAM